MRSRAETTTPQRPAPRVLVVDDVPDVRDLHSGFLRGFGMDVSTAENGVLALDEARRAVPQIVVTDIQMPVMNGLDLCRRLRADPATRDIGVVVVTGDASDWIQAVALDAGCDVVLAKPCPRTLLLATVRRLLERPCQVQRVASVHNWTVF
jgi:CheY-like chemotaxis protein